MPYLSASAVVIDYEEALYQVYVFTFTVTFKSVVVVLSWSAGRAECYVEFRHIIRGS